jgi:hypothetical protein
MDITVSRFRFQSKSSIGLVNAVDMSSLGPLEVSTAVANETSGPPYTAVGEHGLHIGLLTVDTVKIIIDKYTAMCGAEVVSMPQSHYCHYSPLAPGLD